MMLVLLVAGIGFLLAGLVAIGFGIPVNEFSFGNTLIVAGATATCCGAILLGLWTVVRELRNIARQLGSGAMDGSRAGTLQRIATAGVAPEGGSFPFSHDQLAAGNADSDPSAPSAAPWQEEAAARNRTRDDVPPPVPEPAPAVKPRRNLLFSSSSRKERERAEVRVADPSVPDLRPAPTPPTNEAPPVTFDDAWPQSERSRGAPPQRRSVRPPALTEADPVPTRPDRTPPMMRNEDQAPVTILKSGVVDGMAYSLYSDGSIEAQMPEGMMRFGSIDELRSHLDQRP